MIRWIVTGCLITAVLLISAAFALANYWVGLLPTIIIGATWLVGVWHGRSWLATLGLVGIVMITAVAGIFGLSPALLLTTVALALFAWTMGNIGQQLTAVPDVRDEPELIKKQGQWAGGVIGLGWLLGLVALNVQVALTFGWTLALGIVIVFALSRFVRHFHPDTTA